MYDWHADISGPELEAEVIFLVKLHAIIFTLV